MRFFQTETGNEPVREWLRGLSATDKKTIGEYVKAVQFGWPLDLAEERLKQLRRRT